MHGLYLVSLFILLAVSLPGAEPKAGALLLKDDFERTELGKQWRLRIGSFAIKDGHLVGTENPEDGHGAVIQAPLAFTRKLSGPLRSEELPSARIVQSRSGRPSS